MSIQGNWVFGFNVLIFLTFQPFNLSPVPLCHFTEHGGEVGGMQALG